MNAVLLALLAAAIVWIQCWIGGTRLVFSSPPYGLIALAGLLTIPLIRKTRPAVDISCLVATSLLAVYVLLRAAFSPIDYLWWSDFYMMFACVVAYLLIALHLQRPTLRSALVIVLFILTAAQLPVAFRQFSLGDDFMAFGLARPPSGWRASGFFISPNSLAGFLEAMAVLALSFACWSRWPGWVRGVIGILTAISIVGIVVTGSRGGYISIVVGLFTFSLISLWIIRHLYPDYFRTAFVTGGLVFAVFLVGTPVLMSKSGILQRRLVLLSEQFGGGNLDARIYNWQAALDQFRQAPALGTGAGTHLYYGRLFRRPPLQADPVHAHNDYLELLAEYGIVGAGLMVLFIIPHLLNGARAIYRLVEAEIEDRYRPRTSALPFLIGSLCAITAYVAHSVVDFNLHIPGNALLFAVFFGVLANPGIDPPPDSAEPGKPLPARPAYPFLVAVPGLSLLLFICGFHHGLPILPLPLDWQPARLSGEVLAEKARVALRDTEYEDAINLGGRALAIQPRNPEACFTVGEANRAIALSIPFRSGRRPYFDAAVAAYWKGLDIFPQDEGLLIRMGQALDGLNQFSEAGAAFEKALALDPNLGMLHFWYATHLRACGRVEEAQEQLTIAENLVKKELGPMLDNASFPKKRPDPAKK